MSGNEPDLVRFAEAPGPDDVDNLSIPPDILLVERYAQGDHLTRNPITIFLDVFVNPALELPVDCIVSTVTIDTLQIVQHEGVDCLA